MAKKMLNPEILSVMDTADLMNVIKGKGFEKIERSLAAKEIWKRRNKKERTEVAKKAVETRRENGNVFPIRSVEPTAIVGNTALKTETVTLTASDIDSLILKLVSLKAAL
jgi:hypothetical protein